MPVQAGLYFSSQNISASAIVVSPDGVVRGGTEFWQSTSGMPPRGTAVDGHTTGLRAAALQTPDGFFADSASFSTGWYETPGQSSMHAATKFGLSVRTDTADTPLVLDFAFLGSRIFGGAYYGDGTMQVGTSVNISAGKSGAGIGVVWGFGDQVALGSGSPSSSFVRNSSENDVQGIGLPADSEFIGWTAFVSQGQVERQAFFGTLDFGLLQPGESFHLDYEASVDIEAMLTYGGDALAELVDPFSLGDDPPLQFSLRGLDLPTVSVTSVAEPASLAAMFTGLGLLGAQRFRRRRQWA